ncbi:hypothetical protein AJ87_29040 [Rhizobium yanglingense]|nr:hypothetical protein AJ87_29040 [Rhizobium yanglingense]
MNILPFKSLHRKLLRIRVEELFLFGLRLKFAGAQPFRKRPVNVSFQTGAKRRSYGINLVINSGAP